MKPMQKTGKKLEIDSYEMEFYPEETRKAYEAMTPYEGDDVMTRFFCHILPRADEKSLAFLEEIGILPEKLFFARPVAEPDENGQVLFLCVARFCGKVLKGGETKPRQSVEEAQLSMVFVGKKEEMTSGVPSVAEEEVEIRFVISLPFDGAFFENLT